MDRLRRRFPHTLVLQFDPQGAPIQASSYAARVTARSDVDVCCDFLTHVRSGAAATDDERALLEQAVEASRTARGLRADEGVVATTAAQGAA
jgi:exonuclease SbcD